MWQLITMNFSFQALWSPFFIFFSVLIACLYLWVVGPGRHRFNESEPVPVYKKALFLLGIFFFYFGFGGPLYLVGHLTFSVHMMQMAVSFLFAPPLLLIGAPKWLLKTLILKIPYGRLFRFLGHPLSAILLFNALFSLYHFPVLFDYLMVNKALHNTYQAGLFLAALIMWWAVIAPVPEWNRISELQRMGLIFLDGVLLTPSCALLAFSSTTVYQTFTDPQIWAQALSLCLPFGETVPPGLMEQFMWLSLLEDQRLGGVLMKVIQEVLYGGFLGYIFFQWVKREKGTDAEQKNPNWLPEYNKG